MNSPDPDRAMFPAQPSLWRRAPAWRRTLVLAVVATTAAAALLVNRKTPGPQEAAAVLPAAPAPAAPPAIAHTVAAKPAADDAPPSVSVPAENPATGLANGSMRKEDARVVGPAARPPDRVMAKVPKSVAHEQPRPVPKPAVAVTGAPQIAVPTKPLVAAQPLDADSACPNLARLIPLTEPRYNQGQIVAVRSTEVSANTVRRSLAETGGAIDPKYQYQIDGVLRSKVPLIRNGHEMHLAALIPPDLHVQPGDIVAWDGAYRDAPGTCHYVPARIRAVLGHSALQPAPAPVQTLEPPASPSGPPLEAH